MFDRTEINQIDKKYFQILRLMGFILLSRVRTQIIPGIFIVGMVMDIEVL